MSNSDGVSFTLKRKRENPTQLTGHDPDSVQYRNLKVYEVQGKVRSQARKEQVM